MPDYYIETLKIEYCVFAWQPGILDGLEPITIHCPDRNEWFRP